ncbi:MAG TPA: polysaccharide biosynthesis/export family protein [Candidatus Limisoma intestinavium]|uniref:Polysaccharide biosynthesis/export family protein n=1 Tax=Candidatus Limisoma intestinavium TaxID=2840856 RepID=A0A9D1IN29_9BACT|nr:polysaccharide biosynthesis/export family protein [Candidatus Limisoma intestinavium]
MRRFLLFGLVALLMSSCNTSKEIIYLQDVRLESPEEIKAAETITIEPKDMLSIVVSSSQPDAARIFNLPIMATQASNGDLMYDSYLNGYVVDGDGYIDFPVVGKIKASGLNRWQLQDRIMETLRDKKLLDDPVVTVDFMNFKVSILGEVTAPGTYSIKSDKVSVLEAIAMARDLTIYGKRDEVYVIREEGGQRHSYKLDLRSSDIFDSPAYYLKQNDVIYVQPNKVRAGQSTINQNTVKSVSMWVSIASLLTSIGVLVANIVKM